MSTNPTTAAACSAAPGWYCSPLDRTALPALCQANWYCPGGAFPPRSCPQGTWSPAGSYRLENCTQSVVTDFGIVIFIVVSFVLISLCCWYTAFSDWNVGGGGGGGNSNSNTCRSSSSRESHHHAEVTVYRFGLPQARTGPAMHPYTGPCIVIGPCGPGLARVGPGPGPGAGPGAFGV